MTFIKNIAKSIGLLAAIAAFGIGAHATLACEFPTDLVVEKSGQATVAQNGTIQYKIVVKETLYPGNPGTAASKITVTDELPAGATLTSYTITPNSGTGTLYPGLIPQWGPDCTQSGTTVTCRLGGIHVAKANLPTSYLYNTVTVVLNVKIPANQQCTPITNVAKVSSFIGSVGQYVFSEPNTSNNTSSTVTTEVTGCTTTTPTPTPTPTATPTATTPPVTQVTCVDENNKVIITTTNSNINCNNVKNVVNVNVDNSANNSNTVNVEQQQQQKVVVNTPKKAVEPKQVVKITPVVQNVPVPVTAKTGTTEVATVLVSTAAAGSGLVYVLRKYIGKR